MPSTIALYDEMTTGEKTACGTLHLTSPKITVREIIRDRVRQEVETYNTETPAYFQGLVQPVESERLLNGYRMKQRRKINWQEQYDRAIQAFQSNGFIVLVNDRQIDDLDTELELDETSQISFLRLMPLVGG